MEQFILALLLGWLLACLGLTISVTFARQIRARRVARAPYALSGDTTPMAASIQMERRAA